MLTNRVVSIEIDLLPQQLSIFADTLRAQVIEIGSRLNYPAHLPAIAAQLNTAAVLYGGAFQPEIVQTIAAQVAATVLRDPGTGLQILAAGVRAQVIEIGVRLGGRGVRYPAADATPVIAEIGSGLNDGNPAPTHLFALSLATAYPVPSLGTDAGSVDGVQMFSSPAADKLVFAWQSQGAVSFTSTIGTGWTPIFQLQLTNSMDAQRAYLVLEQKVR
jgi:hypothetical protein